MEYGNLDVINYSYDSLNRVSSIDKYWTSTDHNIYNYKYDNMGNVSETYDGANNFTTKYTYDSIGRFVNSLCSSGFGIAYSYDAYNRLSRTSYKKDSTTTTATTYSYNENSLVSSVGLSNGNNLTINYDGLNRVTSKIVNTTTPVRTSYEYSASKTPNTSYTTTQVSGVNTNDGNYDEDTGDGSVCWRIKSAVI